MNMSFTADKNPIRNKKGFTLIEVMIVTAIFGVLSATAMLNYIPMRKRAFDSTALSDARNLVDRVMNATLNGQDIDFTKINSGGPVGDIDTAGNPRKAIYSLSPGVEAVIAGDTNQGPNGNQTVFHAIVYHVNGTKDPGSLSGKKEYVCELDEVTGTTTTPSI